jgi:hypothetical protein
MKTPKGPAESRDTSVGKKGSQRKLQIGDVLIEKILIAPDLDLEFPFPTTWEVVGFEYIQDEMTDIENVLIRRYVRKGVTRFKPAKFIMHDIKDFLFIDLLTKETQKLSCLL